MFINYLAILENWYNTFEAEDYFLTSAAAFYKRDNWKLQVNIDNLFDIDYLGVAGLRDDGK